MLRIQVIISFFIILFLGGSALAVPTSLSHQGRLLESDGAPMVGVATVTFRLYAVPTGGSALWTYEASLTFDDGFYSTTLGPGTPTLSADLFNGSDLYLGLTVAGQDEFEPRHKISTTPYAWRAAAVTGQVEAVGGLTVDGQEMVDESGNLTVQGTLTVADGFTLPQSTFSNLPTAGNDNKGDIFFVTDREEVFVSTGSQWVSLAGGGNGNSDSSPPNVNSVNPSQIEPNTDTTITINGQTFEDGAEVEIGGTLMTSVTFVNANTLEVATGTDLVSGNYNVRVTNPVGLRDTLANALIVDGSPEWVTEADLGSVLNAATGDHITLEATDPEGQTLTYSMVSGQLPPGLSLDSSSGVISGDPDDVESNTNFEFTVTATDTAPTPNVVERDFTLMITPVEPSNLIVPSIKDTWNFSVSHSGGSAGSPKNVAVHGEGSDWGNCYQFHCGTEQGWWKVDMLEPHTVESFVLVGWGSSHHPDRFQIQGSNNDSDWTTLYTSGVGCPPSQWGWHTADGLRWNHVKDESSGYWIAMDDTGSYRYYRIIGQNYNCSNGYMILCNVMFWGYQG